MLSGIGFASATNVEAQSKRRVIVVRQNPYRFHRPFGFRSRWGYPDGYDRWGYDPGLPTVATIVNMFSITAIRLANALAEKQGFKSGKDDGKKGKSYSPERYALFSKEAGFGNFGEALSVLGCAIRENLQNLPLMKVASGAG